MIGVYVLRAAIEDRALSRVYASPRCAHREEGNCVIRARVLAVREGRERDKISSSRLYFSYEYENYGRSRLSIAAARSETLFTRFSDAEMHNIPAFV